MPSAVWQGFCSLLRDPLPLDAKCGLNRPYFWGSLGGHCASMGLAKASKTMKIRGATGAAARALELAKVGDLVAMSQ